MKAIKIILFVIGILVAAMLIIPLFAPATTEVSAETEIALTPSQIFPQVASFQNREVWDPWVSMDSTTRVTIESKPGYVGSNYSWDGEKLGTGRMEVISVTDNVYIQSSLWFSGAETPSMVEWTFELVEGGTQVVWSFSAETTYPLGRLRMMIGKGFLKHSFETGLASLKEHLESMPLTVSTLGPISMKTQDAMVAMAARGGGTVETISTDLGRIYGLVTTAILEQGLEMAGPPFADYLDYDETTGHFNFVAGVAVTGSGVASGEVVPVVYNEMQVIRAMHTGSYEELAISYGKLHEYARSNGLEPTGEVFEFYLTDPQIEPDASKWKTLIAFPIK